MARCQACLKIVVNSTRGPIRVWTSYNDLESSANAGCESCDLFVCQLAEFYPEERLRESSGEIQLYAHDQAWWLSCTAPSQLVELYVQEVNCIAETDEEKVRRRIRTGRQVTHQAREWLRQCGYSHKPCRAYRISEDINSRALGILDRLPKRLIDLREEGQITILDCKSCVEDRLVSAFELEQYCTLSYRWGETPHDCTLSTSFCLAKRMTCQNMPQTFKDGFDVARGLGLRFIWIDALCIVQPTPENSKDWHEESVRMCTIYENAVCTVAASCARHADDGFLLQTGGSVFGAKSCIFDRVPEGADQEDSPTKVKVQVQPRKPEFFECVSMSPLNERGWVMQERALSSRVLHFTEFGLFWECGAAKAHDRWGYYDCSTELGPCRQKESMMSLARARNRQHLCPVEWFHFVKQYSFAQFTHPSDRPVALSSVARAVQPFLDDQYLHGLWRKDLVRGLAWQAIRPTKLPRSNSVPSWSWMSVDGPIGFTVFEMNDLPQKLAVIVDVTPSRPPSGTTIYGGLADARLRLKGTLAMSQLRGSNYWEDFGSSEYWDEPQNGDKGDLETEKDGANGPNPGIASVMDTSEVSANLTASVPLKTYTVLPLAMGQRSMFMSGLVVGSLILEPIGPTTTNDRGCCISTSGTYRRLGWLQSSEFLFVQSAGKQQKFFLDQSPVMSGVMKAVKVAWENLDPADIMLI